MKHFCGPKIGGVLVDTFFKHSQSGEMHESLITYAEEIGAISSNEYSFLVQTLKTSNTLLQYPLEVYKLAGNDTWMMNFLRDNEHNKKQLTYRQRFKLTKGLSTVNQFKEVCEKKVKEALGLQW